MNKEMRSMRYNLDCTLRGISNHQFHQNLVASPPNIAPKCHSFQLIEEIPIHCRVAVKGSNCPLKIQCVVLVDKPKPKVVKEPPRPASQLMEKVTFLTSVPQVQEDKLQVLKA
jgi:hypothetical protein